ncbi:MAG TPA: sigma-70 family RNA polymerase sigma factor [Candidatus Limnocylindrales bacterium]|nr:sigma-70 family RNA polymerase sigma factor [Candidatus Limnocylindrales bacterium]
MEQAAVIITANERSLIRTRQAAPDPGGTLFGRVPPLREQMMGPTSSTVIPRTSRDVGSHIRHAGQAHTITAGLAAGFADVLVVEHMPMAARIARSFTGRGEDLDDLTQVAMLELVRAATRFDPARGIDFANYAHPCIVGGIKKYFRDNGWSVHITRRMQELYLRTSRAIPHLTQMLGRTPTIADLASYLRLSERDTRDGVNSGLAYNTRSLSTRVSATDPTELGQLIGGFDEHVESVPDRHVLRQQVACLPAREQTILQLRFGAGLSQREIAEQLGISQMHVSRMLARTIGALRAEILAQA